MGVSIIQQRSRATERSDCTRTPRDKRNGEVDEWSSSKHDQRMIRSCHMEDSCSAISTDQPRAPSSHETHRNLRLAAQGGHDWIPHGVVGPREPIIKTPSLLNLRERHSLSGDHCADSQIPFAGTRVLRVIGLLLPCGAAPSLEQRSRLSRVSSWSAEMRTGRPRPRMQC